MKLYDYLKERADTYLSLIKDSIESGKIVESYTTSLWSGDSGETFYGCVCFMLSELTTLREISSLFIKIGEAFYRYFNTEVHCKLALKPAYFIYQTGIKPFREDIIYICKDSKNIYILSNLPTEIDINSYLLHSHHLKRSIDSLIDNLSLDNMQFMSIDSDDISIIYNILPNNAIVYGSIVHIKFVSPMSENTSLSKRETEHLIYEKYIHPSIKSSPLYTLYQGIYSIYSTSINNDEVYNFKLKFINSKDISIPIFRAFRPKQNITSKYLFSIEDKYHMPLASLPEDILKSEIRGIYNTSLEHLKVSILEYLWYITRNPILQNYVFSTVYSDLWTFEELKGINVSYGGAAARCKCCSKISSFYYKNIPLCSINCINKYLEFEARKNFKNLFKGDSSLIKDF